MAGKLYTRYKELSSFWRFTIIFLVEFAFFFGANLFKYWYFFESAIPWRKVLIETAVITVAWSLIWQYRNVKAIIKKMRRAKTGSVAD